MDWVVARSAAFEVMASKFEVVLFVIVAFQFKSIENYCKLTSLAPNLQSSSTQLTPWEDLLSRLNAHIPPIQIVNNA